MHNGSTVIDLLVKFIPLSPSLIVIPDITVILSDGNIKLCIVCPFPDYEYGRSAGAGHLRKPWNGTIDR
jgi:hypothetical protein